MVEEIPGDDGMAARLTFLRCIPWLSLLTMLFFATATLWGGGGMAKTICLLVVIVLLAIWFIACFTGDASLTFRHGFVFAYSFTFASFALLITPLVINEPAQSAVRPPEGALQLVSGCVKAASTEGGDAVSRVTRCPAWAETGDAAASSPGGYENARRFPWLVSIGGVAVRQYVPVLANPDYKTLDSYAVIEGGLAVPLFVIVLAFIGGAVSLSRRIPEYQRRASPGYVAAAGGDPALSALEARESVVFQIMQLVSAPFLAVATWYAVTPTTLAAAAGLAFGTGFASEPLLLMIRGMVDGLRPAVTLKSTALPASDVDPGDHEHGDVTDPTPDEDLPPARGGVQS
jgi:hypothetical protein